MEGDNDQIMDSDQDKKFVRPEGLFGNVIQSYLRQVFRQQVRHQQILISQQSLSQFKSLKVEDMECEFFTADPCIEKHLQTFLNREHCQQILELNAQTMKIESTEAKEDFFINCQEDYIKGLKQNHLLLSQEYIQKNQEYFLQLWELLQVRPGEFTRLMRQSVRTLLVYQVYFNSYCHWIKERGQWAEFQEKHKDNINFLTAFFNQENQNLDKVVPLEKEYYIAKLLTLSHFLGHNFNITPQTKRLHSKKKLKKPQLLKELIAQAEKQKKQIDKQQQQAFIQ